MSVYDDEDKLTEAVHEFDRLMAGHESPRLQAADQPRDAGVDDLAKSAVDAAKPRVNTDDTVHDGIELVQLPVAQDNDKSKHHSGQRFVIEHK